MFNAGCSTKETGTHLNRALMSVFEQPSGNKKDLVRVRILYFSSRRESFHIDVFTRRIGTFYEVRFARNGNSVRIISFCDLRRRGRWRRRSNCRLHWRRATGLNRAIRIERLLRRRVFLGAGCGITRDPLSGGWRWRLFAACSDKEGRKQSKRQ
jgi:hypothetical protein